MTINLETEVVATRFDGDAMSYTIQRGTKRWTISVPLKALDALKGNKIARRNFLANALETGMRQQDPDPEAPAANPPANPQVAPW